MSLASDMLSAYIMAETAVLKGQSYRFGERLLTLANLPEIIAGRREWEQRVQAEAIAAQTCGIRNPLGTFVADFSGGTYWGDRSGRWNGGTWDNNW